MERKNEYLNGIRDGMEITRHIAEGIITKKQKFPDDFMKKLERIEGEIFELNIIELQKKLGINIIN